LFGANALYVKEEALDFYTLHESSARKLEFLAALPHYRDAKRWILSGELGSAFIHAAAKAGLEMGKKVDVILRRGRLSGWRIQSLMALGNLGAKVRICRDDRSFRWRMGWRRFLSRFLSISFLPEEGRHAVSTLGHASALFELKNQIDDGLVPRPHILAVPVDSGLSLAGFLAARELLQWQDLRVVGVMTEPAGAELKSQIESWAREALSLLGATAPQSFTAWEIDPSVATNALLSWKMQRWIVQVSELEGLSVDHEHTGLALFGLHRLIERESIQNQVIVFWSPFCPFRSGDIGEWTGYKNIPSIVEQWIADDKKKGRLHDVALAT
jgi:1-aminocyclopropane-1-carboxylate deaminase/D-cysteine desulfhydrase-like pyridoxal-dependent ACC family enzyme